MKTWLDPISGELIGAPSADEIETTSGETVQGRLDDLVIQTLTLTSDSDATIPTASFSGAQECHLTIKGASTFVQHTTPSAAALFAAVGAGTYRLHIRNDNTEPLQLLAGSGVTLDGRAGMYIMCNIYNNRELLVNVVSATKVTITSIGDIPCMVRFQPQAGQTGFGAEAHVLADAAGLYYSGGVSFTLGYVYEDGISLGEGVLLGDVWLYVAQRAAMTYLSCSSNALTSLDVTECPALTYLDCSSNALTS
ncbi:MAG: leucine-rich repeat domain-containing protein, partial [Syntrophaceae bacterium]